MKLFELFATLGLQTDSFEKGIQNAAKQGNSFASSISGNFTAVSAKAVALGNAMYDVGKKIGQISIDGIKNVIKEYADTEQLVGGVETIFKGSASKVIANADAAFRTAGMSANEYMQTVTSFSSSLLQGLGGDTEKAAEVADMAMRDMSDNANKFGTDIGMIMNAYQGFAKDNFTMLDNLKLGYGGTQAEMARLINDSGVLGDTIVTAATVSQVPLDKMFEAIHAIQQQMDVTGTTAKEASSTISGSFGAFSAAWKNFVSGMGSDKDMEKLVDDLFDTGKDVATNILNLMPRIWDNVLETADSLLKRWDLFQTLKKAYTDGGWSAVWKSATDILSTTLDKWGPLALDAGANVLAQILTGITGDPITAEQIKATLSGLWDAGNTAVSSFVNGAKNVLADIYTGFTGQEASETNIKNTLASLFAAGQGNMNTFLSNAKGLLSGIYQGMTGKEAQGTQISTLLGGLFSAGIGAVSTLKGQAENLLGSIYTALTGQKATAENVGNTIGGVFNVGVNAASDVITTATTFFLDVSKALGDPDATAGQKIAGVFEAGTTAMDNLIEDGKTFFADLYVAITGDETGKKKLEMLLDGIFAIPQAILNPVETFTPTKGINSYDTWEADYRRMAQTMYASPAEYGITEDQADKWISALMSDQKVEGYDEILREIIAYYNKTVEDDDTREQEEAEKLTAAAEKLEAAAETLANMQITISGGPLVGYVSRTMARNASMVQFS